MPLKKNITIRAGAKQSFQALVELVRGKNGGIHDADIPLMQAVAEAELDYQRARETASSVPKVTRDGVPSPEHRALDSAQKSYIQARKHLYDTVIVRHRQPAMQEGAQPGRRRAPARDGVPTVSTVPKAVSTWVDGILNEDN